MEFMAFAAVSMVNLVILNVALVSCVVCGANSQRTRQGKCHQWGRSWRQDRFQKEVGCSELWENMIPRDQPCKIK